jgi:peptide/nickel transport system substrate-binding protein
MMRSIRRLSFGHFFRRHSRACPGHPRRAACLTLPNVGLTALLLVALPAQAQSLKIGLAEDPDTLDPVVSRAFVARIVMTSFCDALFDIDAKLNIVPQLGTGWSWSPDGKQLTITLRSGVVFQDGEPFDAAAVKFNLERDINFPGSNRRSELPPIKSIDIVDPLTVRISLDAPFAPLVGVLTDRAGMMLSPKAASAPNADMANHPVCAGPFRLVERVAQDRIVVERFDRYWNKDHVKLDKITFLPLPDSTVRVANLKSGDLDMIERVLPTDLADLEANPNFKTTSVPELGYYGMILNLANGPAAKTPFGSDARVRQAFDLSLDREAINQVIFAGKAIPGEQFVSPESPFHDDALKPPVRDIAKAKALLQQAGAPNPSVTLLIGTAPVQQQLGQMIQAMAQEAGFDIKLQAIEFASGLAAAKQGNFQAIMAGWSGRLDPDGNAYSFLHSSGALNDAHYANAEVDRMLDAARVVGSTAERKALYNKIQEQVNQDLPILYLYHTAWIWAYAKSVQGFTPVPDGMIRVIDLTKS